jgi:cellulose synthase/poly-beta-1,6-N-acetylglucosamine synthase-like glycosyltransferase
MSIYIFWISFLFILYTYVGYPLLLWLLAKVARKDVVKGEIFPTVSVVIAAHNEERNIGRRIEDLLAQDYPAELMEIIVVSDGSSDRTEKVVINYASQNVKLLAEQRSGKANSLNTGVAASNGEIIIFTDVRQSFAPDTIRRLVENFNEPSVGCVSGELLFYTDGDSSIKADMGAYWRYEKWIRKMESASGSVIGATGAVYAIRPKLFLPHPRGTILDDVLTPMDCIKQGYRTVFDASARAYDSISSNVGQEWQRKVRTLAGNWQLFNLAPWLLYPFGNPHWWRYISHKLFRLLVPFGMAVIFVDSLMLSGSFFRMFTFLQLAFYTLALLGFLLPVTKSSRLVSFSYFFIVMNVAAVAGFWKWLTGGCATAWQPAYTEKVKVRG